MPPADTSPESWITKVRNRLPSHPVFYSIMGLLVLCAMMAILTEEFLEVDNLTNILRQVSINAIIAVGMTFVILAGGIDLSVGAVMALSMTITAGAMLAEVPPAAAVGLGMLVGIACGAVNGVLVAYVGLPAIIVTLAMMEIPRGIALLYTGGYPLSGLPSSFEFLGRGQWMGIQTPVLIMAAVFLVAYIALDHFAVGRYIYGIGGNEEAVRLSGVRVRRYKLLTYVISGLTAAIAGIVLASRLASGQPDAGHGFELDAIAAVVLGGTAITGGRGHILGTLVGAIMLGVLNNGLNLMDVSPYMQRVLKGCIIILGIYAGTNRRGER